MLLQIKPNPFFASKMKLLNFVLAILLIVVGCKKEAASDHRYSVETMFGEIVFETNSELEANKYALNLNLISKSFGSKYCFYFVKERKN